jgi:type II secretory pathway component PulM
MSIVQQVDSDASGMAAAAQSHDAHLSDVVIEFAKLAGVSASRVEAIACGEETTRGELESLGEGFVTWIREVARRG